MAHYRKSVNTAFFDKWSPAMAYVLGYFAADGCMYINSHGSRYIGFTSTDHIQLKHVRKLLHAQHHIMLKSRHPTRPTWKPIYQLQIGGGELFDRLSALGLTPNKSCSLKFPHVPSDCVSAFVRGYFDGDGCISFGWYRPPDRHSQKFWIQVAFVSGSLGFLSSLDRALQQQASIAPGYLRRREQMGCYLYYQRREDLRRLYQFLYPECVSTDLYLGRKRRRYKSGLKFLGGVAQLV